MYLKIRIYLIRLYNSIFRNSGVYVQYVGHNVLSTYYKFPPLNYVLKPFSKINHYINAIPDDNLKPFVIEFEHFLFLSGESRNYEKMISCIGNSKILLESDLCKGIIIWSEGTKNEMKKYIDIANIEHKIHVIRPASRPIIYDQEETNRPFTILNIGNKFWVKGTFLAIEAFKRFNQKYPETKFNIVCNDIPIDFDIPRNIFVNNKQMLSSDEKESLFKMSDVFLFPCLHDSYGVYIETLAFKLPMISSKIYDKDEIILNNKCGYLIRPPFSLYEHNIGVEYKNYEEFIHLIQKKYKAGEFEDMIAQMVDRLDYMYNNRNVLLDMGDNCQKHLVNNFSVEQRNLRLKNIYKNILKEF